MVFQTADGQGFINTQWRSRSRREGEPEAWAADPRGNGPAEVPPPNLHWPPAPAPSHRGPGAIPGAKGPGWECRSHSWEQVLWVICPYWQIYLFCLHLCYQGPRRNFFPNAVWHVLVSLVLGNNAAFWSDWDCTCKYVLYLNYLLGEAFIIIKTFTLLTHFKFKF